MDTNTHVPLRCHAALFRSLAATVVPEAESLSETEWSAFYGVINQALNARPNAVRSQLSAFVSVIRMVTFVRHATSFTALSRPKRYAVLHSLETSRVALLRKGMWGLRTVLMMGFYARPDAGSAIGYRASRQGWGAVRRESTAQ